MRAKISYSPLESALQEAARTANRERLMLSIEELAPKDEMVSVLRFAETLADEQLDKYVRELAERGAGMR